MPGSSRPGTRPATGDRGRSAAHRVGVGQPSLGDDVVAPFVGVPGRRIGRALVGRQVRLGRVGVVDDAGVAQFDDPGRGRPPRGRRSRRAACGQARSRGARRGAPAARAPASPGRRATRVAAADPRAVPCASISEVMVSGPTQVIRAGQMRAASVSETSRGRQLDAADHLPDRTVLVRGRVAVHGLGVGERLRDRPVRVGRHDDDRQRAAGPREVGQAADAGLALGVGEGAFGRGGRITAATVMGRRCYRSRWAGGAPSGDMRHCAAP